MIETITVKYDGEYHELSVAQLDLNPDNPADRVVLNAVAQHLGADSLNEFVVEPSFADPARSSATVLNVRPTATFG